MVDSNLSKNDPFRGMEAQSKADRTPDFSGGIKGPAGGGGPTTAATVDGTSALKADLNDAEKMAAKKVDNWSDLEDVKEAEQSGGGFYSGTGRKDEDTEASAEGKAKKMFKKGGPIGLVMTLILGLGGAMFGLQASQPFSLVAQFMERFNSMHATSSMRANAFYKYQMQTGRTKKAVVGNNIFGHKFTLSEKQIEKLKEQGIEFDENYEIDGKKTKVLKYEGSDGEQKIVTADDFKKVYSTDSDFFKKYNAGSMTWRGQIASWFGTTTKNFFKNNNLTRDMWNSYKEKLEEAGPNADPAKITEETIKDRVNQEGELKTRVAGEEEDDNGNKRISEGEESSTSRKVNSEADVRSTMNDISAKYNAGANAACALVNTIGAISLLVTANEALEIINLTTGLFEAVDKSKAGYADETPIKVFADKANAKKINTNVVVEGNGVGQPTSDGNTGLHTVAVITNKSAMEAASVASVYGGGKVDPNDPSVQSFNVTSSMKRILGGVGTSMSAFRACTLAKMSAAVVSGALDAIGLVACLATGVGCIGLGVKLAIQTGIGAAMGAALSAVVGLLVPKVANMLLRDLITDLGGEDLGNAWTYGAILYQESVHRANGGAAATISKYAEFSAAQQQVIADDARYERETLSPFDVTSNNTFMGTIMKQLMSFSHASSLTSMATAGGSAIASSLVAMTPAASAYRAASDLPDSMEEYEDYCPYQASVDAVGAANCPTYAAADMSMMDNDPADNINHVADKDGFSDSSDDDNIVIEPKSEFAKWINFCANRTSPLGVADQNIANAVSDFGQAESGAVNGAIGALPVIGDAIEIVDDAQALKNSGYINGAKCVVGGEDWNEVKYYAAVAQDFSQAEAEGLIDKSPVTAYLEDYYKEHPLDNSYEGILARYSGLTKDNVVAILDIVEYENYIANYDPSDRYQFGEPVVDGTRIEFDNENVLAGDVVLLGRIVYADVRNRSFAV